MLKRFLYWAASFPLRMSQVVDFEEDESKLNLSFSHILKKEGTHKDGSFFVLLAQKNCPVCEMVKLWMDYYWIPHIYMECKPTVPPRIPKFKHLTQMREFKIKGREERLFLNSFFPQIEFSKYDKEKKEYIWELVGGNDKVIRGFVEEKISKNLKDFPYFEAGVYGDKEPEQQVVEQYKDIVEKAVKKESEKPR